MAKRVPFLFMEGESEGLEGQVKVNTGEGEEWEGKKKAAGKGRGKDKKGNCRREGYEDMKGIKKTVDWVRVNEKEE